MIDKLLIGVMLLGYLGIVWGFYALLTAGRGRTARPVDEPLDAAAQARVEAWRRQRLDDVCRRLESSSVADRLDALDDKGL